MAKLKSSEKSIERLVKFCKEELNYDVEFTSKKGVENQCDPEHRLITIDSKLKPHLKMWTLMHESAHAKIFELSDYHASFGLIAEENDKSAQKQTNRYKYQKLKEEMLAWEVGLNIAKTLNIAVDEEKYEKYAAKCYLSYVYLLSQPYYQRAAKRAFQEAGYDIVFNAGSKTL